MTILHTIQQRSFPLLMAFFALSVMGIALIPQLSLQYLPQHSDSGFTVQAAWPGASAQMLERDVVTPLEGTFALIEGLQRITSRSEQGQGFISIKVDPASDLKLLRFELSTRIRQIFDQLPDGVTFPRIHQVDPQGDFQDRPLFVHSLGGSADVSTIYRFARDQLAPQLAVTDGISRIEVRGGNELEWRVICDPTQMEALQIDRDQIAAAIRTVFTEQVLGIVRDDQTEIYVSLSGLDNENTGIDWEAIPIRRVGNQLVRLGDLAEILRVDQPAHTYYRVNGSNSIRLVAYAEPQSNQLEVARSYLANLDQIARQLPSNYQVYLDDDATDYLRAELKKIGQRTFLSLAILLVFLLLVYRKLQYFLVVAISLLVNLAVASLFYYAFDVQLHLYALAAITVSFGLIVDNVIVTAHHLKIQRNLLVLPALVASTLTTAAALVVIFFLPRTWQVNLTDFALVLIINLGVSLLVATLFIPSLLTFIPLRLKSSQHPVVWESAYRKLIRALVGRRWWIVGMVVLLFGTPIFLLPNKVEHWSFYNALFDHDVTKEHVRPVLNRLLGGTLRLFMWYVYEGYTFRSPDETILYVRGTLPEGSTLDQLNEVYQHLENFLQQYPGEVQRFVTQVSSGQYGSMAIYFNEGFEKSFPYLLKNRLVSYSTNLGGVEWSIFGVGRGFSNSGGANPPSFQVNMYGYNDDELARQAAALADLLLEHPRVQEVNANANLNWYERDKYRFSMDLSGRALAAAGLTANDILNRLDHFDQSTYASFYVRGREPVRLLNADQSSRDLWQWEHEMQRSDSTAYMFVNLGNIRKEQAPQAIYKEDQQYLRSLEFVYNGSYRFGSRYLDQCLDQFQHMLPLGYQAERRQYEGDEASRKRYSLLLLVMALIFFICSIQFESFRQAFSIVLLIPMSFIGIFLVFYWWQGSFDQGGYTSFILLSGLVVNSLILIINDYNFFHRQQGVARLDAYLLALRHKLVPVLLTVGSTVLGLLPFLMHGRQEVFWFSLALGTIGGLLFSVLVLLLVMPCVLLRKVDL